MRRKVGVLLTAILLLCGFATVAPKAGATESLPYPGTSACISQWTKDGGWHLSERAGYVYHYVEDNFFAYQLSPSSCMYTVHAVVDLCNNSGCYLAAWEAWMPYWSNVNNIVDYTFDFVRAPYYNNSNNAGVLNSCRNCASGAWELWLNNVKFDTQGSETERLSTIRVNNFQGIATGVNTYFTRVAVK